MISGKQILWGTLGWAFGGPIGGILGVIFAGSNNQGTYKQVKQSQAGDFMVSLLVLFAKALLLSLGFQESCFLPSSFAILSSRFSYSILSCK